jgi:hypothetical protein
MDRTREEVEAFEAGQLIATERAAKVCEEMAEAVNGVDDPAASWVIDVLHDAAAKIRGGE